MAEKRPGPHREQSRRLGAARNRSEMARRVDAVMNRAEVAGGDEATDRRARQAGGDQLAPRDAAALRAGDRRNPLGRRAGHGNLRHTIEQQDAAVSVLPGGRARSTRLRARGG